MPYINPVAWAQRQEHFTEVDNFCMVQYMNFTKPEKS